MLFEKISDIYFSHHMEHTNTVCVTQCFLVLQRVAQIYASVL